MSHGNVIRRTIAFPSLNAGGAGGKASNAIPDPRSSRLPYVVPSGDTSLDPAALSTYDDAARVISIPSGTVAIGIAPDSLIHSCDISLTGDPANAIRVAPGLPLLGCRGEEKALITLPTMPYGVALTATTVTPGAAGVYPADGQDVAMWPLRLEFFRGDVMPMRTDHRRAPMVAKARVVTEAAVDRFVYVCVDGRRKIALAVAPSTQDVTVTVTGLVGYALALDDLGTTTVTVTAGTSQIFSFDDAAPFLSILQIKIDGAGAGTCYVEVRAED